MADDPKRDELDQTLRIMGALVRMPPKPHDQMKLGKSKGKPKRGPAKRAKSKSK
jgi:hypothetical protein